MAGVCFSSLLILCLSLSANQIADMPCAGSALLAPAALGLVRVAHVGQLIEGGSEDVESHPAHSWNEDHSQDQRPVVAGCHLSNLVGCISLQTAIS